MSDEYDDIELLKRQRSAYKGKLTTFRKYLSGLGTDPLTTDDILDLELRTNNIDSVFHKFDSVQEKLESVCTDTDIQVRERDTFEDLYFTAVAKANGILKVHKKHEPEKPKPEVQVPDSIKFPEISLPTFKGEFKDWIEFRETFDALINQSSLHPIQKFKYLRSCLQDNALDVVSSVEYSADNYLMAWSLLCERYNNPRLLVSNHLKGLFECEPIQHNDSKGLRSMVDNINKHLRSLRSLSIPTDEWDPLLIYFLSAKLPTYLQEKWEERIDSKSLPSLQDFKTFLRKRADLLETKSSRGSGEETRPSTSKKALVTTSSGQSTTRNTKVCPHCKTGRHFINQCNSFLALSSVERIRAAKRYKLCTNCLGSNHMTAECRSSTCKYCLPVRSKHHSLLHIHNHTPNNTTLLSAQTIEHGAVAQPAGAARAANDAQSGDPTYQSPGGSGLGNTRTNTVTNSQNKTVFLATAIVYVKDTQNKRHSLRVLLDSGSQSNFITERAFKLLNLNKKKISLEVLGFNEASTKINYMCELRIEAVNNRYVSNASCLIVPNICNLPTCNINTNLLNIPQHIKLADEAFYLAREIDILIGAELFWDLVCSERLSLGQGLPSLQNTRLGWVVSGPYFAQLDHKR